MAAWKDRKQFKTIHGKRMAYVEEGTGDPIVFLHGNPTSSYLWRNVMPHLVGKGRLIAPDLIGMGDSEKLDDSGPDRYTFVEHAKYLFALLEALDISSHVTLVVHDWGAGLGLHWASQNAERLRGLAMMEGVFVLYQSWDEWPDAARGVFQGFRSPMGEEMVLQKNVFVENVLPGSILRKLTDEEMAEYRRPFAEAGEGRRPTLTWPRQIPIAGEPEDVTRITGETIDFLSKSPVPKLFINAEPGAIITAEKAMQIRTWPNLTEVTVKGAHFIQEDSPDEIGQAIAAWLPG